MRLDHVGPALRTLFLAALLIGFATQAARPDYALDTGDVLEIAIFGVPDFNRRTNVNVDGDVAVPFLGEVRAAGLSIGALRREVERRLAEVGAFRNPNVTVELVVHRPFYISGDVMRPGAHPFQPGMTVRHAVALAGGYSAMRYQAENPLLLAPELESRHNSLWVDLIARNARVLSLTAQLEGAAQWDASALYNAPLPRTTVDQLIRLETRGLDLRLSESRMEESHLNDAIAQAESVVAAMEKAVEEQEESIRLQVVATERATANSARGITPNARIDEERRALAHLRSQHLDATSRMMNARREVEQQRRLLERTTSEREQGLIAELREATSELERAKFQLRATGEQLVYAVGLRSQIKNGNDGLDLVVMRPAGDKLERILVTEDSAIEPGDVLEIMIRPDRLIVVPDE